MQIAKRLEDYQVLFLEGSPTHQELFDKWLSDIPTRFASTLDDVYAQFDDTVAVVCLSQPLLEDNPEEIRNHVLTRSPFCQIILIAPRSSTTPPKEHYDAFLQRPVFEDDLQTTVEDRVKYGAYSSLLHEFYSLNVKISTLRKSDTPADFEADLDLDQLVERRRQIIPQLKRLQSEFTNEDIREISQGINRHKEFLTEPDRTIDQAKTSKHRPNNCPACDLAWGPDHGNELGTGYISMGSGVWKCSRCDELIHGLHDNNQRVL